MPLKPGLHARVLRKAADQLGGLGALSAYLKVPTPELYQWMRGHEQPPVGVFLKAVDLILDEPLAGPAGAPPSSGKQVLVDNRPKD